MILYLVVLLLFLILFVLRLSFFINYFNLIKNNKNMNKINNNIDESKYTIIQPILSGDFRLEKDLEQNLKNSSKIYFFWLIDKNDTAAIEIANNILNKQDFQNKNIEAKEYSKRVKIFFMDDVPQSFNPKVFKIKQVIDKVKTDYTIILDDDTVIDMNKINEFLIYEKREDEWLLTGIPYNYGLKGFYSKLISAFINSNSFLTYLSMAYIGETKTINGMFYMAKTSLFLKYNVFEEIQYMLCDDFELAQYMINKKVKIIQSTVFCNVRTTVLNFSKYILLMKRWLLFSKIYIKNAFSIKFLFFVLIPSALPGILFIVSIFLKRNYIYLVFTIAILLIKSYIMYKARYYILRKKETKITMFYEILSDITLLFLFVYMLITPPIIIWRNKKIRVLDRKIRYE